MGRCGCACGCGRECDPEGRCQICHYGACRPAEPFTEKDLTDAWDGVEFVGRIMHIGSPVASALWKAVGELQKMRRDAGITAITKEEFAAHIKAMYPEIFEKADIVPCNCHGVNGVFVWKGKEIGCPGWYAKLKVKTP